MDKSIAQANPPLLPPLTKWMTYLFIYNKYRKPLCTFYPQFMVPTEFVETVEWGRAWARTNLQVATSNGPEAVSAKLDKQTRKMPSTPPHRSYCPSQCLPFLAFKPMIIIFTPVSTTRQSALCFFFW